MQAKGGGLAFIQGNRPSFQQNVLDGKPSQVLLVYIDGDHEYVVFDPHSNEAREFSLTRQEQLLALEETGEDSFNLIYYFEHFSIITYSISRVETIYLTCFVLISCSYR